MLPKQLTSPELSTIKYLVINLIEQLIPRSIDSPFSPFKIKFDGINNLPPTIKTMFEYEVPVTNPFSIIIISSQAPVCQSKPFRFTESY